MCGIAGIFSKNEDDVSQAKLTLMSEKIKHRGPDGFGFWISEDRKLGFAHRRLSIIDLDVSANQPMHYLNRYTIVFNGEIYNYIELREFLKNKGYSFRTSSDTEVLLALYDFKGERLLEDLDGMFAFVIYDNVAGSLFCARDRFGEKPFYYYKENGIFLFASEMKALWAAGVPKIPNNRMIYLYLAYNTQHNLNQPDETFYQNIWQLEPSHCLLIDKDQRVFKKKYWDIDLKNRNTTISIDEAALKFTELFTKSITRRLRSDVPVGSSLSGGLDSSSIVMFIDRMKSGLQIQKTFSARFEGFVRDEGKYIEKVLAEINVQPYHVFLTPEGLIGELDKVCYYQEEPFGSTSVIAQWEVMKLAKKNDVTVLMDGQGADEVLAGYFYYFDSFFSSLFRNDRSEFFRQRNCFKELYDRKHNFSASLILDTLLPKAKPGLREIKNKWMPSEHLQQFHSDFSHEYKDLTFKYEHSIDLNESLYFILFKGGLQNLLRYADRNAMANGVEVRLPFLSHELVEFVFSLPDNFKLRNGWTKFLLRESMKNILPQEICWRKEKIGFEPPDYKSMDAESIHGGIEMLTGRNLLNRKKVLESLSWEYVQISKLFL